MTSLVLSDLDELEQFAKDLARQTKVGAATSDRLYLQIIGLQILAVSKLEFLLKKNGIVKTQKQILDLIARSETIRYFVCSLITETHYTKYTYHLPLAPPPPDIPPPKPPK